MNSAQRVKARERVREISHNATTYAKQVVADLDVREAIEELAQAVKLLADVSEAQENMIAVMIDGIINSKDVIFEEDSE